MEMYYFFNELGDCFCEKLFASEDDATAYADKIGAEYFCTD